MVDAIAVVDDQPVTGVDAAGNQRSAFAYGSAFARAIAYPSWGGTTVSISGTAAIDADGRTMHAGDTDAQIRMALINLRAVMRQHGCTDSDLVQVMAYCRDPGVAARWEQVPEARDWPCVTIIADICRDDLAFEIEATAWPSRS